MLEKSRAVAGLLHGRVTKCLAAMALALWAGCDDAPAMAAMQPPPDDLVVASAEMPMTLASVDLDMRRPIPIQSVSVEKHSTKNGEDYRLPLMLASRPGNTVMVAVWAYSSGLITGVSDDATPPNAYRLDKLHANGSVMFYTGLQERPAHAVIVTNKAMGSDVFSYAALEYPGKLTLDRVAEVPFTNIGKAFGGELTTTGSALIVAAVRCYDAFPVMHPPDGWSEEILMRDFNWSSLADRFGDGTFNATWLPSTDPTEQDRLIPGEPQTCVGISASYKYENLTAGTPDLSVPDAPQDLATSTPD